MPHCGAWEFWRVPLSPGGLSIPVRLCRSTGCCASVVSSFGAGVQPGMCPWYVSWSHCSALVLQHRHSTFATALTLGTKTSDSFHSLERCVKGVGPWIFERKHNMFLYKVLLQLSRNCRVRLWDYVCTVTRRVAKAYWTLWLMLAFPMTVSPAALLT